MVVRRRLEPNASISLGALLAIAMATGGLTSSCERVVAADRRPTVSPFRLALPMPDRAPEPLGEFRITYYYVAHEDAHEMLDAVSDLSVVAASDANATNDLSEPAMPVEPTDADPIDDPRPRDMTTELPQAALAAMDLAADEDVDIEIELEPAGSSSTHMTTSADGDARRRKSGKRPAGFVTLFDYKTCQPLATVNRNFAAQIAMQGTGRLANGRLLNYVGSCACNNSPCFQQVSSKARWGTGAHMRALTPFRSIAVDPAIIKLGTKLYIPELDGLQMPGQAPWGNFVHDGCVTAEDTGGAIDGHHIDFFVAGKQHYNRLDRRYRLKKVTVFDGAAKCAGKPTKNAIARR